MKTIFEIFDMMSYQPLGWENPSNPKPGKAYNSMPENLKEECKVLKSCDIKDVAPHIIRRLIGGS